MAAQYIGLPEASDWPSVTQKCNGYKGEAGLLHDLDVRRVDVADLPSAEVLAAPQIALATRRFSG